MNPKSTIFLFILISIVLFMVGVNVGKRIEIVNKAHPFVTPTIIIQPTTTPIPLVYKTFTSTSCGVSFLYPEVLQDNSSSTSAQLANNTDVVKATCDKKVLSDFNKNKINYKKRVSLTINSIKVITYEVNNNEAFEVINPFNGKIILFETSPNLSELVGKSIELTK